MKFFAVFIEVNDYQAVRSTLITFKEDMKGQGGVTVFDLDQSQYDFLYNSLIERAKNSLKNRGP